MKESDRIADKLLMKRLKTGIKKSFPAKHPKKRNAYMDDSRIMCAYFCRDEPKMKKIPCNFKGIDTSEINRLRSLIKDLIGIDYLLLYKITPEGPALLRIWMNTQTPHYLKGVWFAIAPITY